MGLMHQVYDGKYSQKSRLSCSGSPAMGQGWARGAEAPPGQASSKQGSTAPSPAPPGLAGQLVPRGDQFPSEQKCVTPLITNVSKYT